MTTAILADLVVLLHLAFILFVLFGGLLVLRWRRLMWMHLPVVAWGAAIEFVGWVCPLTPLENRLRAAAGDAGYGGGFIEHYLIPLIYPADLTRELQWLLGAVVLVINAVVYWRVLRGRSKNR